ncbi:MAG TPA: nickel-dependent hydrogenase large subunit [Spirochaetota bacterium]
MEQTIITPKRTIIPFGPQHPVLPEPLHFDVVLEDEKVVDAIPTIGYIHRGLEMLVEKREFTEMVYVAERICGICSFIHGLGYCQSIEEIMSLEVPKRAQYLRVIWSELSRIHSHLLWLGLAADAFGYENLFMRSWRARETVLDIIEETSGGRVIFGSCKVGGVRRDIDKDTMTRILGVLAKLEKEVRSIGNVFLNDSSVKHRLCDVGVLSMEDAKRLGAVGPMLRASGVAYDVRSTGYAVYDELSFNIPTETSGDCYARSAVRVAELFESFSLVRQAAEKIPDGELSVKVTGAPNGEAFQRLEQPRGEVIYYVKGNGTKFLTRFRARTPTFANIPAMIQVMKGSEFADIPNIVLTIDPCISCTER